MKYLLIILLISCVVCITSCDKEYINPSTASPESVTTSSDALMILCAGLQRRFTIGRQSPLYNTVTGGAFGVFGAKTIVVSNVAEFELEVGKGSVSPANGIVSQLWSQAMLGRTEAETVLNNLNQAVFPGDKVGLKGYSSVFYALNVGSLAQFFEKMPLVKDTNAVFATRVEALQKVVSILESADADLATTAPSTKFLSKVPAGIDLKNTVKALLARYYNMLSMAAGTYDAASGNKAVSFAQAASTSIKSEFRFSVGTPNPLGDINVLGIVYGVSDSTLGLKNGLAPVPAASDPRIGFYISKVGVNYPFKGFSSVQATSFPVYLPGEMSLIIAENFARQNQFPQSKTTLDAVLTKTTDIFGVNAAQPAYTGALTQPALLNEIYKQRRIELFMSGQELEDSRRFNRPAPKTSTEERNRTFYPYPLIERNNNTRTPLDPDI
ncbi:MAG: RagB/SusD family nutrient uptake outer membrane protein [Ferruginibacter sp.]|nr:RagB/SusD family nutrient uptake outer membrane protein [Ferruginibacter sp.]